MQLVNHKSTCQMAEVFFTMAATNSGNRFKDPCSTIWATKDRPIFGDYGAVLYLVTPKNGYLPREYADYYSSLPYDCYSPCWGEDQDYPGGYTALSITVSLIDYMLVPKDIAYEVVTNAFGWELKLSEWYFSKVNSAEIEISVTETNTIHQIYAVQNIFLRLFYDLKEYLALEEYEKRKAEVEAEAYEYVVKCVKCQILLVYMFK